MKFSDAIDFLNNLISQTDQKSEIRIYEKFIGILSNLEDRDLTEIQLKVIQQKLDTLKANPEDTEKHVKQQLAQLMKYLKDEFSLISKGYYTAVGISLGVAFGVAFGSLFDIGMGLVLGMLIGLIIGASMDSAAEKENRVLKSK